MHRQPVFIKRVRPNARLPVYGTEFSAGADLCACLDAPVTLAPNETRLIPIGIAAELPEGYVGLVFARSVGCNGGSDLRRLPEKYQPVCVGGIVQHLLRQLVGADRIAARLALQ